MSGPHQEAAHFLDQEPESIPTLLQSRIHLGLAGAYARLSCSQEANYHLQFGNEASAQSPTEDLLPRSDGCGTPLKILLEGSVLLDLGQMEEEKRASKHALYEAADRAFAQIDQLPPSVPVAERIRLEIINQRALVAVKSNNMEQFRRYLLEGVQGAKALGSEKRQQEALANWKAARKQWPKELRVLELADLFL
jgi:hypothetical protein